MSLHSCGSYGGDANSTHGPDTASPSQLNRQLSQLWCVPETTQSTSKKLKLCGVKIRSK